jgi:surface protein
VIAYINGDTSVYEQYGTSIGDWCVDYIEDFSRVFHDDTSPRDFFDTFNDDISRWNTSGAKNMSYMFASADAFNQDLSSWDVSSVTDMSDMFSGADIFNQDLSSWDVSSVTDMSYMFAADSFNRDLSSWDVSSVIDMAGMFYGAVAFNQNLCAWANKLNVNTNVTDMFAEVGSSSCPNKNDPVLVTTSRGPFCYPC